VDRFGARLAGASATKTATVLAVSSVALSRVMTAFTDHGKRSSSERNSGRNAKLSDRNRRTLKRTLKMTELFQRR